MGDMDLGRVSKVGPEWKDDWWGEVFAEIDKGGDWNVFEVLRAESDDFALGYEEGDHVFYLTHKAAELGASDHGACGGREMHDLSAYVEIEKGWISVFGMFVMLKGFEHEIFVVGSPAGEVLWVFGGVESVHFLSVLPSGLIPCGQADIETAPRAQVSIYLPRRKQSISE